MMKYKGSIVVFIILIISSMFVSGYVLRPRQNDVCLDQINTFHKIDNNTLDAIAYGSSHCWFGFDSNEFKKKTGLNTYNYGCYFQSLNTTELFFDDSLRKQSPKIIFIETGRIADIVRNIKMEGQLYYTRKIPWSINKIRYIYGVFGRDYASYLEYLFPIATFHANWKEPFKYAGTDVADLLKDNGQKVSQDVMAVDNKYIGAEFGKDNEIDENILILNEYEGGEIGQIAIPDESLSIMNRIREKCDESQIKIIWFTIPYVGDYNYSDAMKEYVSTYGGEYVNLYEHLSEIGFDGETDMLDGDHVNASGAKKITNYLADYCLKNNIIKIQ